MSARALCLAALLMPIAGAWAQMGWTQTGWAQTGWAQTGALLVEGNALRQSLDCTGRDVVVRGERNALVFTGGCASLEVQGNVSTIRAELAPGARVTLRGEMLDLSWSQTGVGAAPRIAELGRRISIEQTGR